MSTSPLFHGILQYFFGTTDQRWGIQNAYHSPVTRDDDIVVRDVHVVLAMSDGCCGYLTNGSQGTQIKVGKDLVHRTQVVLSVVYFCKSSFLGLRAALQSIIDRR
jgi:hypothetical protein